MRSMNGVLSLEYYNIQSLSEGIMGEQQLRKAKSRRGPHSAVAPANGQFHPLS